MESERFKYWNIDDGDSTFDKLHTIDPKNFLITASMVPEVFGWGCKGRSTKHYVELFKGNIVKETPTDFEQSCFDYGHRSEPLAANEFLDTYKQYVGIKPGFIFHPEIPWLGASPDLFCVEDHSFVQFNFTSPLNIINVEVKAPFLKKIPEINSNIPIRNIIQVQVQMACTGLKETLLYIWSETNRSCWRVPRNEKFIEDIIHNLRLFKRLVETDYKLPFRGSLKKNLENSLVPVVNSITRF